MERDCIIAHGASAFLQERLMKVSDQYKAPICMNEKCGQISSSLSQCSSCGNDEIVMTSMPYATKLLIQELGAMSLKIKVHPKKYN